MKSSLLILAAACSLAGSVSGALAPVAIAGTGESNLSFDDAKILAMANSIVSARSQCTKAGGGDAIRVSDFQCQTLPKFGAFVSCQATYTCQL